MSIVEFIGGPLDGLRQEWGDYKKVSIPVVSDVALTDMKLVWDGCCWRVEPPEFEMLTYELSGDRAANFVAKG